MFVSHRNLVCDAISDIAAANSLAAVSTRFAEIIATFGFSAFTIGGLPPAGKPGPLILTEIVPKGFRQFFIGERLYAISYTAIHARNTVAPFRFSDAPYGETHLRDRYLSAIGSFGIGRGIVVPTGRAAFYPACAWLSGKDPDLSNEVLLTIEAISRFMSSKVLSVSCRSDAAPKSALTARERGVLQWIAAGKTSWEISVISNSSERAINSVIADAMIKLDAVTRVQAVVNAIRCGEIEL